ncbi:DNA polymerase III subunit gamma/tau [Bulleidia sp. HCP3S3_F2]|uniref:DNA polymerase III subunit gamma/tau n=1 Tax=unclassified Bulleidia TaxID=2704656 RepID=UPI003F8A9350
MAKIALYQKYRSSTFEEVVGQEYIVKSIKNAVKENKVGHAYLFCGPRGTGKTTMARLLAKAVNCENPENAPCEKCENCVAANSGTHPDIIEINAANETHVEDIRDLIERSRLAPMQGKHKVYIIDEVHQLSSAASSALLKTLEEPPENVIFILATTDPQKLLPTIISRCQRYDFTKVRTDQIRDHLLNIAKKENIIMEENAAMMIAVLSDGGMRDALSIMDQCASYTSDEITVDAIDRIYGLATTSEKIGLIEDILNKDLASILTRIQNYEEKGIDFVRYTDGMIDILKDSAVYSVCKKEELLKVLNQEEASTLSSKISSSMCMQICEKLLDTKSRYKQSTSAARVFEVMCLSLATEEATNPIVNAIPAVVHNIFSPLNTEERIVRTPVISEPVKQTVEEKTDEVVKAKPVDVIPLDKVLSILLVCNKQNKVSDENTLSMIGSYADLNHRKYTTVLNECKVAASGNDCILLYTKMQSIANRINEEKMNREIYEFMRDVLHTDKVVFAITEDDFIKAKVEFVNHKKEGTLPEPIQIEKYKEESSEESSTLEKVKELFGEDNIEIV